MASLSLRPPASFNFRKPEEWKKWKSRFEQYCLASGLSKESAERQVSTLLYCMGEDAEAVLATTRISTEDRADYSKVVEKYDEHFKEKISSLNVLHLTKHASFQTKLLIISSQDFIY